MARKEDPGRGRRLKKRAIRVRTPGGRVVVQYRHKVHSKARCALCGRPLTGTPTGPKFKMRKLAKSERRPNRPFGGYLCSRCARKVHLAAALS